LEEDGSITDLTISRTSSETFEEILATEIASEQSEQEALAPQEPSEEAIVSADVVMEISDISSDAGANPRSEALVFAVDTQQDASSQDNFAEIESEPVEDAEIDDAAVEEAFLPPHLDIHAQLENIAAEMNKEDEEFTMQQVFDEDPVSPSVTPVEGLLSATAAQASLAALANLKRSLVQPTPVKVSTEEGRTVEDLLGDLLKPLLKEWLDTNLPLMVEKIVSQEIKKLTSAL
jgi:cell pole-organizing protein PopZ